MNIKNLCFSSQLLFCLKTLGSPSLRYFGACIADQRKIKPDYQIVTEGQMAEITCFSFSVEWSFCNGSMLSNVHNTKENTLTIWNVTAANEDCYLCSGDENFVAQSKIVVRSQYS